MKNKVFLLILSLLTFGTTAVFCATAAPEAATAGLAFDASKRWELSEATLDHMKDEEHLPRRGGSPVDPALRATAQSALEAARINPSIVVRHTYKEQPSFLVPLYDDVTGLPAFFYTLSMDKAGFYCVTTFLTPEMARNSAGENGTVIERLMADTTIYEAIRKEKEARTAELEAADAEIAKDLATRAAAIRALDAIEEEKETAARREKNESQKKLYAQLHALVKIARERFDALTQIRESDATTNPLNMADKLCCFYAARETLKNAPEKYTLTETSTCLDLNVTEFRRLLDDETMITGHNKEKIKSLLAWVNGEHSIALPATSSHEKNPSIRKKTPPKKRGKREKSPKKIAGFIHRESALAILTRSEELNPEHLYAMRTIINDHVREYSSLYEEYQKAVVDCMDAAKEMEQAAENLTKVISGPTSSTDFFDIRANCTICRNKMDLLDSRLSFIEVIALNSMKTGDLASSVREFKNLIKQQEDTFDCIFFAEYITMLQATTASEDVLERLCEAVDQLATEAEMLENKIDTLIQECRKTCTLPRASGEVKAPLKVAEDNYKFKQTPSKEDLQQARQHLEKELRKYAEKTAMLEKIVDDTTLPEGERKTAEEELVISQWNTKTITYDIYCVLIPAIKARDQRSIKSLLRNMKNESLRDNLCTSAEKRYNDSGTLRLTDI